VGHAAIERGADVLGQNGAARGKWARKPCEDQRVFKLHRKFPAALELNFISDLRMENLPFTLTEFRSTEAWRKKRRRTGRELLVADVRRRRPLCHQSHGEKIETIGVVRAGHFIDKRAAPRVLKHR